RAVALAGATSLPVQAALCAIASLAVCNDSGLAHLAAAVGTPTVVIFGSTSSAWSAPLGARVRVVQRAPVCSPCFQRHCRIGYGWGPGASGWHARRGRDRELGRRARDRVAGVAGGRPMHGPGDARGGGAALGSERALGLPDPARLGARRAGGARGDARARARA